MRRFIFYLFTQSTPFIWLINNTLWFNIGSKSSASTALSSLFPSSSQKTLIFLVAMAGNKRSGEGPSNDPPSIRHRHEYYIICSYLVNFNLG